MPEYYFDYSANTPVDPEVLAVYTETAAKYYGNPNSSHAAGRAAREIVGRARDSVAEILGVGAEEIIFTSGASESNNLAIKGIARAYRHKGRHMISTPLEHSSVSGALTALQERGWEIDLLDVREDGRVDTEELRSLIREDTVLISVCAVDSELGTVQPVREIAEIAAGYPDCFFHVDATQAVGKTGLFSDRAAGADISGRGRTGEIAGIPGIDLLSFTPHKFYGLTGSGVLVKRKGVILEPLIHGGASTTIYRSGTPDAAAAAALAAAFSKAVREYGARRARVEELNRGLRASLSGIRGVHVNSPAGAVPHILNLGADGIRGERFQQFLDEHGVCVSVKSACSVKGTPSRAVMAVTHSRRRALESWRISLSHLTTDEELRELAGLIREGCAVL